VRQKVETIYGRYGFNDSMYIDNNNLHTSETSLVLGVYHTSRGTVISSKSTHGKSERCLEEGPIQLEST
jgi:hypothetical protein